MQKQDGNRYFKSGLFKKFLIFFALTILVYVLWGVFSKKDDGADPNMNKVGTAIENASRGQKSPQTGTSPTVDYEERVEKQNKVDAQKAIERNEPSVPFLTTNTFDTPTEQSEVKTSPPVPIVITTPSPVTSVNRFESSQQKNKPQIDNKNMLNAMKNVVAGMELKSSSSITFKKTVAEQEKSDPEQVAQTDNQNGAAILLPGEKVYAVNEYEINSDSPLQDVVAKVVSPIELSGSRFFGKFKRYDEMLVIEFERFVHNGKETRLRALAINPSDSGVDVASDVNTHFIARWAGLFVSSFAEGMANAVAGAGTVNTITTGGAIVQSRNKATTRDIIIEGVGKVGEKAGTSMEANFKRPPTVRVYRGAEMAVVVLENK